MTRKEGYIPTQMAAIEKGAKSVEAGRECPPIPRDEGGMTDLGYLRAHAKTTRRMSVYTFTSTPSMLCGQLCHAS